METFVILAAGVFLLLLNGFFVLAEFAIVKVRSSRVDELVDSGHPQAPLLKEIHVKLDEYLSVCQVGITLASVALGMVGKKGAELLGAREPEIGEFQISMEYIVAILVSYVLISGSHIVIGELVPKSIAIRIADRAALWAALPLRFFHWLFFIPLWALNRVAAVILRLMGFPGKAEEGEHSEDELRIILDRSQARGLLSFRRLLFIENVFDLGELKVKDAMRPRSQVRMLNAGLHWNDIHEFIRTWRYSRYPLIVDDPEKPAGIVHLKDILFHQTTPGEAVDLKTLARPYLSALDTAPLEQVLAEMQRRRIHVALVFNAENRWIGLLSLEDVIEEVVGTITDEFETEDKVLLADVIAPGRVVLGVEAPSLVEAVAVVLGRVQASELPLAADLIRKAVQERERAAGTYLGKGIAMPHARLAGLTKPVVIVARSERGILVEKTGERARLLFILLTPAGAPRVHQRLQATIAAMIENSEFVSERLLDATTPDQIIEILRTGEQAALD
ncbi:hypothetical protein LBMAG53_39980 [Planctomycetota bacterium]|nr:hypothetical protein LBMAG53_39980 [Planctomycetota bacterium]